MTTDPKEAVALQIACEVYKRYEGKYTFYDIGRGAAQILKAFKEELKGDQC